MKLIEIDRAYRLSELPRETLLELQKRLTELGYNPGPVDGIYGPKTQSSFTDWKEDNWMGEHELIGPGSVKELMVEGRPLDTKEQMVATILRECDKQGLPLKTQKAYVLATVEHETAGTFLPVREAYWLSDEWRRRNLRYYPYYGRGHVQITWKENYQKYSQLTGRDLVGNPDLAMEPGVSLFILVHGCKNGAFTGRKIEDYINESKTDYVNARRVINGTDRAHHIASLAWEWCDKI